jgi:peptidoglycan LD-endopeptidase LytH
LIAYLLALHAVVLYLGYRWFHAAFPTDDPGTVSEVVTGTPENAAIPATPGLTTPTPTPDPAAEVQRSSSGLIIPVAGISPDQLTDTFTASRGEGRLHDAIDIIAPQGTPVLAAADGEITKFFESKAGGITIYQASMDGRQMFYYAHLASRAANLAEGQTVTQGQVIGYVGDTGNAGPGNFHLHFSVALITDKKRYWEGTYINPYPLLKDAAAPGR